MVAFLGSGSAVPPADKEVSAFRDHKHARSSDSSSREELIHVVILFRHTVRAPRAFPTSDPLLREELFPRGVERSTRKGLEATRNASLVWRSWYKDFLTCKWT